MFTYNDLDEAFSELLEQKKKTKKKLPIGVDGLSQDKFLESKQFYLRRFRFKNVFHRVLKIVSVRFINYREPFELRKISKCSSNTRSDSI